MKSVVRYGLAILALLACSNPGRTRAPASRADAVVAASKRASGGSAWDRLQGCYEEGTHAGGSITYKTWFSVRRYGMRVESRRGGSTRTMGFNGKASWQTNDTGGVDVRSDADALKEAIVTAYLSNNGFFFPKRFPATFKYVREAAEPGRTFDVLEIAPRGGRPVEFWFDRSTHLLQRVVDNQGTPPVKVEAGDYRRVGNLTVAFSLTVFGPDGNVLDRGAVTSLSCRSVDAASFDPPKTP
jgi:hypothetical protein